MENSETDKTLAYQRQMQAAYTEMPAANFKKEFWPADPFDDGVLIDAMWLDIPDLVAIHKAAKALEVQGNEALAEGLIVRYVKPMDIKVRVNPLFLDATKQRKLEIWELLYSFFYEPVGAFTEKRQDIISMGDPQLSEYLNQVEDALNLTAAEMEVIVNAKV